MFPEGKIIEIFSMCYCFIKVFDKTVVQNSITVARRQGNARPTASLLVCMETARSLICIMLHRNSRQPYMESVSSFFLFFWNFTTQKRYCCTIMFNYAQ